MMDPEVSTRRDRYGVLAMAFLLGPALANLVFGRTALGAMLYLSSAPAGLVAGILLTKAMGVRGWGALGVGILLCIVCGFLATFLTALGCTLRS